jgi:hypothetical protein
VAADRPNSQESLSAQDAELEVLVQRYCGRFGDQVTLAILEAGREPRGLTRLLKYLQIKALEAKEIQLAALANWLDSNGSRAFFRLFASWKKGAQDYAPQPVAIPDPARHDKRAFELLLKERLENAKSAGSTSSTPPPTPTKPAPGSDPTAGIPLRPPESPTPPKPAEADAPTESMPVPADAEGAPPTAYTAPPGYPFPWPPHLKPGPVPPPPDLPPEKLTWPYIDRRRGKDRRTGKERRRRVGMISKNRRFGKDRRKGDRRKKKK